MSNPNEDTPFCTHSEGLQSIEDWDPDEWGSGGDIDHASSNKADENLTTKTATKHDTAKPKTMVPAVVGDAMQDVEPSNNVDQHPTTINTTTSIIYETEKQNATTTDTAGDPMHGVKPGVNDAAGIIVTLDASKSSASGVEVEDGQGEGNGGGRQRKGASPGESYSRDMLWE